MFYRLARPIARYVLRYYYRHLDISGLEHIPARGPVIFASNHPTAFIEPCLLACFQPRILFFLARGDFFKNKLFRFLLGSVNILPVFRLKDGGFGRLKDNFSTFDACYKRLSKGGAIMILAEGSCIHEKRLRPLRKGTARIALGALQDDPDLKEVPVIPVGVHFNRADRTRGQVMIEFGPPLMASSFYPDYEENANQGVNNLTDALRQSLMKLVVHVEDPAQDGLAEAVFELDRSDHREHIKYGISHDGKQLKRIRHLAAGLPGMRLQSESMQTGKSIDTDGLSHDQSDRRIEEPAGHRVKSYFNRLHQFGLMDPAVAGVFKGDHKLGLGHYLQAILAISVLVFWLPVWLLAEIVSASLIRAIEFYSPLRFGIVAVGSMLYVPAWLIYAVLEIFGSTSSSHYGLAILLYINLSIYGVRWAIKSWERIWRWQAARRSWRLIPPERLRMASARKAALEEMEAWRQKVRK